MPHSALRKNGKPFYPDCKARPFFAVKTPKWMVINFHGDAKSAPRDTGPACFSTASAIADASIVQPGRMRISYR